jgi:hypothetical protein
VVAVSSPVKVIVAVLLFDSPGLTVPPLTFPVIVTGPVVTLFTPGEAVLFPPITFPVIVTEPMPLLLTQSELVHVAPVQLPVIYIAPELALFTPIALLPSPPGDTFPVSVSVPVPALFMPLAVFIVA